MKDHDILESWKEIAPSLKRSVKPRRRLAKERGRPVHRLEDSPKARVFAYKEEIDRWRAESQHSEEKLLAEPEEGEPGIPITQPALTEKKSFTSKEVREATVNFGLKRLLVMASVVILFVLGVVLIRSILPRKKSPLVQKIENSIAVISFENQTGDKAYDYLQRAIPNLLITSLEQSGYFSVATWERLYDLLKQKGKGDVESIDRDLGFDLCQMDGIDAIVLGSFTKAGDMFATDVKVLDVDTKKMLKSASPRGTGAGSILQTQIDELTKEICLGMGRPEKKMEATQPKVAEVTTNSVEAYDLYIRGREELEKYYWDEAIRFLKRSIELDPAFAASYLYLSQAYSMQRNAKARDEALEKAKIFSTKANERERLYIEAFYASYIEKDPDKYAQKLSKIVKKFPKDKQAYYYLGHYYSNAGNPGKGIELFNEALKLDPGLGRAINTLAIIYVGQKKYEKAIELFKRYASLSPGDANPYDSMSCAYFMMGNLDEAIAKEKGGVELNPIFFWSLLNLGYYYAYKQDCSEAVKWLGRLIAGSQD